jgi:hypothetical protein
MCVIMSTIEMPIAEGRLLPAKLFDKIDTLHSMVCHGLPSTSGRRTPPSLEDWLPTIDEFGAYYGLDRNGRIAVDPDIYGDETARFVAAVKR